MSRDAERSLNLYKRGRIEGILQLVEAQLGDDAASPKGGDLAACFVHAMKLLLYPAEDINYWGEEFFDTWVEVK